MNKLAELVLDSYQWHYSTEGILPSSRRSAGDNIAVWAAFYLPTTSCPMNLQRMYRIQYVAAGLTTLLALFYAFTQSIEEPLYAGENAAIYASLCLHVFWLLLFVLYYSSKGEWGAVRRSLLLYACLTLPFIAYRFYKRPFDSDSWKTGLNPNYLYGAVPAHRNGDMVQDIIESHMLIGKSKARIISILGTAYSGDSINGKPVMKYPYTNGKLFDGCDKLCVEIAADTCSAAYFCGCD